MDTTLEITTTQLETTSLPAAPIREDRSMPMRDLVDLSIQTIFGLTTANEQQLNQILGILVRSKALTADESYLLKDQLQNLDHFEKALDTRVESVLRQRGLLNEATLEEIRAIEVGQNQPTI